MGLTISQYICPKCGPMDINDNNSNKAKMWYKTATKFLRLLLPYVSVEHANIEDNQLDLIKQQWKDFIREDCFCSFCYEYYEEIALPDQKYIYCNYDDLEKIYDIKFMAKTRTNKKSDNNIKKLLIQYEESIFAYAWQLLNFDVDSLNEGDLFRSIFGFLYLLTTSNPDTDKDLQLFVSEGGYVSYFDQQNLLKISNKIHFLEPRSFELIARITNCPYFWYVTSIDLEISLEDLICENLHITLAICNLAYCINEQEHQERLNLPQEYKNIFENLGKILPSIILG